MFNPKNIQFIETINIEKVCREIKLIRKLKKFFKKSD